MIPIYEQGRGQGIGYNLDSFINRFDEICSQHLAEGRAQSFAFILYDFTDNAVREILNNQGVFAKLDRLSAQELSVFYLHNGTRRSVDKFNDRFLAALGVSERAELPCVIFFKLKDNQIGDVRVVQIDNADLVNGFSEIYNAIEGYLEGTKKKPAQSRALRWLKSGAKFVTTEVFRAALRRGLEGGWP